MTNNYKISWAEKLFGKYYKWWFFFKYTAKSRMASPMGFIFQQSANFISSLAIYYLWYLNGAGPSVLTYLAIGRTFGGLGENYVIGRFGYDAINGGITKRLLVPKDYLWLHFAESVGSRFVKNLTNLIGFVLAAVVYLTFWGSLEWPQSWLALSLPIFLILSYSILFILGAFFGITAHFIHDKIDFFGIENSYSALLPVLSGAIIPLDQMPWPLFWESLPTAWLIHHPMQIYLDKYDALQTLGIFVAGVAWFVVLERIWRLALKAALKRNESVGL